MNVPFGWSDYLLLGLSGAFVVGALVYVLAGQDDPLPRRIGQAAIIIVLSPLYALLVFSLGVLLWPLFALCVIGMLLSPLSLFTRRGRDNLAYHMRRGRWKDRPR
jgi:peptidoglycan/LPS O-acetylase OafA/YrhL